MKLRPVNKQVVIQMVAAKTETESGLVIPEQAQARTNQAVVVAIGARAWERTSYTGNDPYQCATTAEFKVGDRVIVTNHGREITTNNEAINIVHVDDVIAVVE